MAKNNTALMSPPKQQSGELEALTSFQSMLASPDSMQKIAGCVARGLDPDRLRRVACLAATKTPKLLRCTPDSIINALCECAVLGLEPIQGRAYLIPYEESLKNEQGKSYRDKDGNWAKELRCQFQIGYLGLLDLARRSGIVQSIVAEPVRRNDVFVLSLDQNPPFRHVPEMRSADDEIARAEEIQRIWSHYNKNKWIDGKKVAQPVIPGNEAVSYYCYAVLKSGAPEFRFITRSQAMEHRYRHSKSPDDGPWATNFDEMALKTVIKLSAKRWPLSTEFSDIIRKDSEETEEIDTEYVLTIPPSEPAKISEASVKRLENNAISDALDADAVEAAAEPQEYPFSVGFNEKMFVNILEEIRQAKSLGRLQKIGKFVAKEKKSVLDGSHPFMIEQDFQILHEEYANKNAELKGK